MHLLESSVSRCSDFPLFLFSSLSQEVIFQLCFTWVPNVFWFISLSALNFSVSGFTSPSSSAVWNSAMLYLFIHFCNDPLEALKPVPNLLAIYRAFSCIIGGFTVTLASLVIYNHFHIAFFMPVNSAGPPFLMMTLAFSSSPLTISSLCRKIDCVLVFPHS